MNSPIKILYLITSTGYGGAERSLLNLVSHINKKEFSMSVCSLKIKGELGKEIEQRGIPVISLNLPKKTGIKTLFSYFPAIFKLIRIIRNTKPTIIHSLLFQANLAGRISGKICRVPLIINSFRTMEKEKKYQLFIDKITWYPADYFHAVSNMVRNFIIKKIRIPSYKVFAIPNGVIRDWYRENKECRENIRNELRIAHHDRVISIIGRLRKEKGHAVLIKALPEVLNKFPLLKLLIVGEGEEKAHLQMLVKKLKLESRVIFKNFIKDLSPIFSITEILIVPSLHEGMPNIILEAMAAKVAVIASKAGGIPEVIEDRKNGILLPETNPETISIAIINLLENHTLKERLKKDALIRIEQDFNIVEIVKKFEKKYIELLKNEGLK
ncbi:MAG: glycosyltransferase [Thermodesulfobacteriota bacterium]|nr:glycosyltransferase [Thermodesulfobacteriota bacterium]